MRTAHAAILRKSDTAVRIKVTRLDLADGCFYQPAKLSPLLFRDRSPQILNLGCMLSYENYKHHLGNSTDPRIADELRVERKQPIGLLWVAAVGCEGNASRSLGIAFTSYFRGATSVLDARCGSYPLVSFIRKCPVLTSRLFVHVLALMDHV